MPTSEDTRPISVRVTSTERDALIKEAGNSPFSAYLRAKLLGGPRRQSQQPSLERVDLARLLSQLGQSNVASHLAELAEAVRLGGLPVTPETEGLIREACTAILQMRSELIMALGLRKL